MPPPPPEPPHRPQPHQPPPQQYPYPPPQQPEPPKQRGIFASGVRGGAIGCVTFLVIAFVLFFVLIAACSGAGDENGAWPIRGPNALEPAPHG